MNLVLHLTLVILASTVEARDARLAHAPLPEAVASFGATVLDDALYVYGGHIGRAHRHSNENLARGFYRLDLSEPDMWESLPMQTRVQGLALVAHDGFVYRVGGLRAHNGPDEIEDLESIADVARFDPTTETWEMLPPLPEPRSSHDAVVYDNKLWVVGGWTLLGDADTDETRWLDTAYVADLDSASFEWRELPTPPFHRRALALAAANGALVAIGGINDEGEVSHSVHVFDIASGTWSAGPEFPAAGRLKGFGASAFGVDDLVFASGADGRVVSLRPGESAWRTSETMLDTPRFFHRLVAHRGETLFFLGGASHATGHLDSIETRRVVPSHASRDRTLQDHAIRTATSPPSETDRSEAPAAPNGAKNWQGFRGDGSSRSSARRLPVSWTEDSLRWSVDVRGYGQSSPVVWGDRVFVTSIDGPNKEDIIVTCLDAHTGRTLWQHAASASTTRKCTEHVSRAAPTPAVDANAVYVSFESGDVFALDHDGELAWQRSLTNDFGPFEGKHGIGASIVQTEDSLLLLADHEGPSYLLCLDKATGTERWKVDRESRVSWSTPLVVPADAANGKRGADVIVSSNGRVESIRLTDGSTRWFVDGLEGNTVPSPSAEGNMIFIGSSEKGSNLAIRRGGKGDVTETHVVWRSPEKLVSFGSPLLHRGRVYTVSRAGVARALDLETGREVWTMRIGASCWASPLAAGERVYFFNKQGRTVVVDVSDDTPTILGDNTIATEEPVHGVAAVDGAFFVRAGARVFCIGSEVRTI